MGRQNLESNDVLDAQDWLSPDLNWQGRPRIDTHGAKLYWSMEGLVFRTQARGLQLVASQDIPGSETGCNLLSVELDGTPHCTLVVENSQPTTYWVDLPGHTCTVRIYRRTEALCGTVHLVNLCLAGDGLRPIEPPQGRNILFLGDSLTAGYGIWGAGRHEGYRPQTTDAGGSWASLACRILSAESRCICWSGLGMISNYEKGPSPTLPELFEAELLRDQMEDKPWVPDAVVVALGTNDFAHGVPDPIAFIACGAQLLRRIAGAYPFARMVLARSCALTDGYPHKQGVDIPSQTLLRLHLEAIVAQLAPHLRARTTIAPISQQTGELGYGSNGHPSRAQHERNGGELAVHLAQVFAYRDHI